MRDEKGRRVIDAEFTVVRGPKRYKRPSRWRFDWQNFWLLVAIGLATGAIPLLPGLLERLPQ